MLIAMLTAVLTGGKLALSFIPNIEIVTLLIIVYAYVFGMKISVTATLIFVTIETMIWGFNTWVISYFIYWPMLACLSCLLAKLMRAQHDENISNKSMLIMPYTALAVLCSALFGVLTSFVDALVGSAKTDFAITVLFPIIYLRGVAFYITHVISNGLIVAVCFLPLQTLLSKLAKTYYGKEYKSFIH